MSRSINIRVINKHIASERLRAIFAERYVQFEMRKFIYILIVGIILISCSNQKNIEIGSSENLKNINTLNPIWIEFYQDRIANFNPNKFELYKTWQEKDLITGNILADFDSNFNKNHLQFLINSPDNSQYIDLDFYNIIISKNEKGELICDGYSVDQEINWVNRKIKEIKRIGFHGTISKIEDAKWVDNSNVVLFGLFENKLTLKFINLKSLEFKLFIYPDTLLNKEGYSENIRLKNINFN